MALEHNRKHKTSSLPFIVKLCKNFACKLKGTHTVSNKIEIRPGTKE